MTNTLPFSLSFKTPVQRYMSPALITLIFVLVYCAGYGQQMVLPKQNDRWAIQKDGSITWDIKDRLPHTDHIEMSGEKVSLWVKYAIDDQGMLNISRTVVFPTFRIIPNDTYGNIIYSFRDNELPRFYINDKLLVLDPSEHDDHGNISVDVKSISQKGIMRISAFSGSGGQVKIERSLFPSADKPLAVEEFKMTNVSEKPLTVSMEKLFRAQTTDAARSIPAAHTVIVRSVNDGRQTLQPGQSTVFSVCYLATDDVSTLATIDPEKERTGRENRIDQILSPLQLQTPDSILNTEFAFAKIRATESIFKTKRGYMHGPGGLSYYAAIWANDQAEYVSPYFAFSGDSIGNLSAMNCYRLFASYMNPDYKPVPSSIVAEGDTFWNGAGDRGDQAMIAYGASRYALAQGNADSARVLWPLIKWCLNYNKKHLNESGVVTSDADELEGRFPSGKANLSTNSLYYDALVSAGFLCK